LDRLHDGLELNDVEVWIEVSEHSIAWCLCIGPFGSPDCGVFAGTVMGRHPVGTNHADAASLGDRVLVDAAPDCGVIFNRVSTGRCAQ
jgi:hypothetical protein